MTEKRFPILLSGPIRRRHPECPASVPWVLVSPHAAQAWRNYGRTLPELADRGGLGPVEAYLVMCGQAIPAKAELASLMADAVAFLASLPRKVDE